MEIKKNIFSNNQGKISDRSFRVMSFFSLIKNKVISPLYKLKHFNIKPNDCVIDFGCGPGNYIRFCSKLVGPNGTVYAVDIHDLAIQKVNALIARYHLHNVKSVLIEKYECEIKDNIADIIYALNMFHMVEKPMICLKELHRLLKNNGRLYLEDGHQSRKITKKSIEDSEIWIIVEEHKRYLICTPAFKTD